jgi:hypothetical protein
MSAQPRALARPGATVVGGLILVGLLCSWLISGGFSSSFAAADDNSGAELLARAREAATRYDFSGEVVVAWHADGHLRHATVPVREAGGVLSLGKSQKLIGSGDDRLLGRRGDWTRLWGDPDGVVVVKPGRKYTLVARHGPVVAGRGTALVEADRGGRVWERLAVDDVTGLLLRREQLDDRGRVVRAVGFTEMSDPVLRGASPKSTVPRAAGAAPNPISRAPTGYIAPSRLGNGFELAGRYRGADDSVQLFYSDGIYAASVFEQAGALDPHDLPSDATSIDIGAHRVDGYTTASGTVAVWAADDLVYTLVSDAPKRELDAMLEDLPRSSGDDATEEMTHFVLAPFQW